MFDKIFTSKRLIQKHESAPFGHEREAFLEKKAACGYKREKERLRALARCLLFASENLGMEEGDRAYATLESLRTLGQKWKENLLRNRHSNTPVVNDVVRFLSIVVEWLTFTKKMDPRFFDDENLYNRINHIRASKIRYHVTPLYYERLSYLEHLREEGYSMTRIRHYAEYQLHIIQSLRLDSLRFVTDKEIVQAYIKWDRIRLFRKQENSITAKQNFIGMAERWLSYAGILKESESKNHYMSDILMKYENWMKDSRGKSPASIKKEVKVTGDFLDYLHKNNAVFAEIMTDSTDGFIKEQSKRGLARISINRIASVLRCFLRYAYNERIISIPLAGDVKGPRMYSLGDIPYAPDWIDVEKLILSFSTKRNNSANLRNRAIALLLAVYGMRSTEVCRIDIKDIDWENDTILLKREKRGRQQVLPLVPVVGNAIVEYIKEERNNNTSYTTLFLTKQAPYIPMNCKSIYTVIRNAYDKLDIEIKHHGPHSLRHACATRIVNSGHKLKEVADLLGHKKLDNTCIYAKIDMVSLRKVADMNWEGLL